MDALSVGRMLIFGKAGFSWERGPEGLVRGFLPLHWGAGAEPSPCNQPISPSGDSLQG